MKTRSSRTSGRLPSSPTGREIEAWPPSTSATAATTGSVAAGPLSAVPLPAGRIWCRGLGARGRGRRAVQVVERHRAVRRRRARAAGHQHRGAEREEGAPHRGHPASPPRGPSQGKSPLPATTSHEAAPTIRLGARGSCSCGRAAQACTPGSGIRSSGCTVAGSTTVERAARRRRTGRAAGVS